MSRWLRRSGARVTIAGVDVDTNGSRSLLYGLVSIGAALGWIAHMAATGLFGFSGVDVVLLLVSAGASAVGFWHGAHGLFGRRSSALQRTAAALGVVASLAGVGIFVGVVLLALASFDISF